MLDLVTLHLASLIQDKWKMECTLACMHTGQLFTWRLKNNHVEVAKYLCTTLMDLPVSFAESALCNIHSNSESNMLAREDLQ